MTRGHPGSRKFRQNLTFCGMQQPPPRAEAVGYGFGLKNGTVMVHVTYLVEPKFCQLLVDEGGAQRSDLVSVEKNPLAPERRRYSRHNANRERSYVLSMSLERKSSTILYQSWTGSARASFASGDRSCLVQRLNRTQISTQFLHGLITPSKSCLGEVQTGCIIGVPVLQGRDQDVRPRGKRP